MREPCYVTFHGRVAELYDSNKCLVRRYNMPCEVVGAQVSGSGNDMKVSITMADGRWEIREWHGGTYRKGHN